MTKRYLPETHPQLLEEWDKNSNGDLRFEDVTYGSEKKAWWACRKCGHNWKAMINNRTKKINPVGCPVCGKEKRAETWIVNRVLKNGSFGRAYPFLLKEWDYERNKINPKEILAGSNKKVWWVCSNGKCEHSWKTLVNDRTRKIRPSGCPACSGWVATKENNFALKFPGLLKEWDCDKNKIDPEETLPYSNKKIWWICRKEDCKHEWEALISNRTKKVKPRGCPACYGRVATKTKNLAVKFPRLCREWDYKKNKRGPEEITPCSNKKAWWVCSNKKCRHSWKALVHNRTKKIKPRGCPVCARGPVSKISQKWLDSFNILQEFREYYIKDLGFRVDGFDPETNTIYEFLGDFWHGNPERFSLEEVNPVNKKSFGKLHQETFRRLRLLEKAGYKIIYIWEKDYKVEYGKEER